MGITFGKYPSPIGDIFVASSAKGLIEVRIKGGRRGFFSSPLWGEGRVRGSLSLGRPCETKTLKEGAAFKRLFRLFDKYFRGIKIEFDIPLDVRGTLFEKKVWNALRKIPYGQVRTYGEIAKEISMPKSARTVGRACGKNPLPIVIPCHRVVSSKGIGGYSLGIDIKIALLTLEGYLTGC